jgi:hypothetical protein
MKSLTPHGLEMKKGFSGAGPDALFDFRKATAESWRDRPANNLPAAKPNGKVAGAKQFPGRVSGKIKKQ